MKSKKKRKKENGVMTMIEVNNLEFNYEKGRQTLHGLSFSVSNGEIFGFLGPNGSGKSTTQKILTGVLNNYTGNAKVFGKEIKEQNKAFYQDIGVLFEFPYLYTNLSAIDNLKYFISFYPKEKRREIYELLEELEFKKDFINKPVSSYSKGMRQRVSMARALINNPKLLFLDEPISGLDPSGAVLFRNIIEKERQRGTTIFLTTHNMVDADLLCDRVAFIANGDIKVIDTPKNLKEKNSEKLVQVEYEENGKRKVEVIRQSEIESILPVSMKTLISIHSQEPTLEDVFLKYTGKGLV